MEELTYEAYKQLKNNYDKGRARLQNAVKCLDSQIAVLEKPDESLLKERNKTIAELETLLQNGWEPDGEYGFSDHRRQLNLIDGPPRCFVDKEFPEANLPDVLAMVKKCAEYSPNITKFVITLFYESVFEDENEHKKLGYDVRAYGKTPEDYEDDIFWYRFSDISEMRKTTEDHFKEKNESRLKKENLLNELRTLDSRIAILGKEKTDEYNSLLAKRDRAEEEFEAMLHSFGDEKKVFKIVEGLEPKCFIDIEVPQEYLPNIREIVKKIPEYFPDVGKVSISKNNPICIEGIMLQDQNKEPEYYISIMRTEEREDLEEVACHYTSSFDVPEAEKRFKKVKEYDSKEKSLKTELKAIASQMVGLEKTDEAHKSLSEMQKEKEEELESLLGSGFSDNKLVFKRIEGLEPKCFVEQNVPETYLPDITKIVKNAPEHFSNVVKVVVENSSLDFPDFRVRCSLDIWCSGESKDIKSKAEEEEGFWHWYSDNFKEQDSAHLFITGFRLLSD